LDNLAAVQSLRKRLMPNDHDALDALQQLKTRVKKKVSASDRSR